MKVNTQRIHRSIDGVKYQFYSSDEVKIAEIKKKLALMVDELTFPWAHNTVKRRDCKTGLPPTIFFKTDKKVRANGEIVYRDKVILIINRKSLDLYKTFSRTYGTTHTISEAINDVVKRATTWWENSEYSVKERKIAASEI
ncbi:hypothetical protein AB6D11_00115 [Vibrio splendidus]